MHRSPLRGVKLPLIGCSVGHSPFLDGSMPLRCVSNHAKLTPVIM